MGDEIEELRDNLKVSFSRMKQDIHYNKEMIEGLVKLNTGLQEQIKQLEQHIKQLEQRPKGLKSELIKHYDRNKKGLIKQRILGLVKTRQYSLPELKEEIVDEKRYCSKATFYRYIDELKTRGWIDVAESDGVQVVLLMKET